MSETLTPPVKRKHADYGIGPYLLAVTHANEPLADSPDLLAISDTHPKRISFDEQIARRWDLPEEIADED